MQYVLDKFHEECGIVGIYGNPDAANLAYLGLYALQHRGQEASGIATFDGQTFHQERGNGWVADVFTTEKLERLQGDAAVGHNRYSTAGGSGLENVQPLMGSYAQGTLAMVHNGNIVNATILREEQESQGAVFHSTVDSEVILHLVARSSAETFVQRVASGLAHVKGAYSLLFLTEQGLFGVRDPHGVRPLVLGKLKEGYVLASESCAFDLIGADFVRDIQPGEIIHIHPQGLSSFQLSPPVPIAQCVFEFIYFARPDSIIFSKSVYGIRKQLGAELAKEAPVHADIVIAVPDSGILAALGFSKATGIPYAMGLIRNHYVGRTFIEPKEAIRHFGVKVKLNAVREVLEGKRVIVVDDSLVRGTTSQKIIKMLRAAGAKEIHLRISSPPIISPCFYGIDTPTRNELIAASSSVPEIQKHLGVESLHYLSMAGLFRAVYQDESAQNNHFCTACFTGQYPIPLISEKPRPWGLFDPLTP